MSRLALEQLRLQRRKQAFCHGVVKSIAEGSHGSVHVRGRTSLSNRLPCVLRATIRMMNDLRVMPRMHRQLQGSNHQLRVLHREHGSIEVASVQ